MPKSTMQFVRVMALLMLAMSLFGMTAFAQSTTDGAIGGTVTDQSGAVIPNATVKATNLGTNATATATTDGTGRYRIIQLKPGTYKLEVASGNFTPYTAQGLIVEVGRVTTMEVKMGVAAKAEAVDVTGEAPVINTQAPDFATNINQTSINELPINGRRWSQYALLTPGATPDGNFGLISFRGISGLLNNNTVDGGDNNQAFFAEERGRTRIGYVLSQDAVQEFQVNTSNYSAEYGRSAGGVVNAVTKAGTNNFHGSAFWYLRDNAVGATNPFTKAFVNGVLEPIKPEDVRHQWGGSVGGPVIKDKLFFFFSYDQQHRNFPGVASPAKPANFFAPLTATELTTLSGRGVTATQAADGMAFLQSLSGTVARKGDQDIFLPKLDWKINDKHSAAVVYNRMRWNSPAGVQTQAVVQRGIASFGNDGVKVDSLNAKLNSVLTNTVTNELRYQYGRDLEFQSSQSPAPGEPTTANGFSPSVAIDSFNTGFTIGKPNFLDRAAYPDERRWQIADSMSVAWGKHLVKYGVDYSHVNDVLDNLFQEAGAYSYNNRVDYLSDAINGAAKPCRATVSGVPNTPVPCFNSYNQGIGPTAFEFATQDLAFFLQDDWRIHPRVTLNIGLRYEREYLPDPQIPNSALVGSNVFPADKNNLGPRLGAAWDVFGNGKTSVRAGWGLYYGRVINSTISNAITNTGNPAGQLQFFFRNNTVGAPTFPNLVTSGTPSTSDVIRFDSRFELPQIQQFDFVVERELPGNMVASLSYIGSRGSSLPDFIDTNLPVAPTVTNTWTVVDGPLAGTYTLPMYSGARPTTGFGRITNISSRVKSQYDAMVVQLNRRMAHGLQVQANYTYAKSEDTGQSSQTFTTGNNVLNPSNLALEYGRSSFDIRHRFVSSLVWQPLFFQGGNRVVKAITSDWTLSPIVSLSSGRPFTGTVSGGTITGSTSSGMLGAGGSSRVPFIGPNAYNFPNTYNVDFRVSRRVRVKEGMRLEFLAEAFNLFNHVNVTDVITQEYSYNASAKTLTYNPQFGQATAAGNTLYNARQMQFAVRFQF